MRATRATENVGPGAATSATFHRYEQFHGIDVLAVGDPAAGGVKKKERFNANERKWTQMNANSAERWAAGVRASQVLNVSADLQARRTEIDQKAKVHAGGSQIIYALRAKRAVWRLDGLQFDQDSALNQQIG